MKTNAIKITVVFCCKIILLFCCCFAELFGCWLHTQTVNDSLTRYWFFFELITLQLFVESAWIQEKEDTTSSRYPKSLWNTMSRQYVLMYPPLPNQYEIIRYKHHIELLPSNSIIKIFNIQYMNLRKKYLPCFSVMHLPDAQGLGWLVSSILSHSQESWYFE